MKTFKQAFVSVINHFGSLINVKTIVTFSVTAVFMIQALRGTLTNEIVTITTMVLSFYFGVQHEQQTHLRAPAGDAKDNEYD